jgi:hypothetical protein
MNKQTLGTCGNCGGAVTVDTIFFSVVPPKPSCESCGAQPVECHGPVIPMQPGPKRFSWFGVGSELPTKDSLEQALKDRMFALPKQDCHIGDVDVKGASTLTFEINTQYLESK